MHILFGPFIIVIAYLLGAIPYGLVIAKSFCNIDPRTAGSGNIGATNVTRLCGKKWGVFTLGCDVAKGVVAVSLALWAQKYTSWEYGMYLHLFAGFAVVFGHMYSIFIRFNGGKGIATTVGVFLTIAFFPLVIAGIVCLLTIWKTGFVSAGCLLMMLLLIPVTFFFIDAPTGILALLITLLIFYAHRENIKRLLRGEENHWSPKKR